MSLGFNILFAILISLLVLLFFYLIINKKTIKNEDVFQSDSQILIHGKICVNALVIYRYITLYR